MVVGRHSRALQTAAGRTLRAGGAYSRRQQLCAGGSLPPSLTRLPSGVVRGIVFDHATRPITPLPALSARATDALAARLRAAVELDPQAAVSVSASVSV